MHPFCCVHKDYKETGRNPPTGSGSSLSEMNHKTLPFRSVSSRSHSRAPSSLHDQRHSYSFNAHASVDHSPRLVRRSASDKFSRHHPRRGAHSQFQDHREVIINDIVGNGISGILYKWVNFGRGWCPRWFVLQDGVLSYYKIHGRDKIVLNRDVERGSMVIGEESFRRIASHRDCPSRPRKPVGEIHITVCSIRESKSDEKRFSVYTGTKKRLQLRAESREDKTAWVEALLAVKDMFPGISTAEIMAPAKLVEISTEKLRQRLLEEGVCEAVIQDSEQIMISELSEMHKHIVVLKHKQLLLLDKLRHFEVCDIHKVTI